MNQFHFTALSLYPPDKFEQAICFSNLGVSLRKRYELTGHITDLDESVLLHRQGLGLRPGAVVFARESCGRPFNAIYVFGAQSNDLEEAIALEREALQLFPKGHVNRSSSLHNLASSIALRHPCRKQDLDEVVLLYREALELRPKGHPERFTSITNLGTTVRQRSGQSKREHDLVESISLLHEALDLLPKGHPERASPLVQLSVSFLQLFHHSGQDKYLDQAIIASRDCLAHLPHAHPKEYSAMTSLATALAIRYERTRLPEDLANAIVAFRKAVKCASYSILSRFKVALSWASLSDTAGHDSALEAYRIAIDLLPCLAVLGLDVQSRREALKDSEGLASRAAACAIRLGHLNEAVELLEQGRGVFWTQALQLRTPLDDLKAVAPDLGQRLENIARSLEIGGFRDASRSLVDSSSRVESFEREAIRCRHLNEQWLHELEKARELNGFEDFIRPKRIAKLAAAAAHGPVVILITSNSRCDALVLRSSGTYVEHVPLPKFKDNLTKMGTHVLDHVPGARLLHDDIRHAKKLDQKKVDGEDILKLLLAIMWESVVKPIFDHLHLLKSDHPPRLWWCPTGLISSIPIHAAGIYDINGGESVSDYVVPSYIPTLSTLLVPVPQKVTTCSLLAAIQPNVLPCTLDELRRIKKHMPEGLVALGVDGAPATVANVLSCLPDAAVVHFACHGYQDVKNPLNSALILEDGNLTVFKIMQSPPVNASLVFLSACQTATSDDRLPDEVIHLAATMLFAGFRSAVATMWSILDIDGPIIADEFYGHFVSADSSSCDTPTDAGQSARALHLAVAKFRAENLASFSRWVPFVHFGL